MIEITQWQQSMHFRSTIFYFTLETHWNSWTRICKLFVFLSTKLALFDLIRFKQVRDISVFSSCDVSSKKDLGLRLCHRVRNVRETHLASKSLLAGTIHSEWTRDSKRGSESESSLPRFLNNISLFSGFLMFCLVLNHIWLYAVFF